MARSEAARRAAALRTAQWRAANKDRANAARDAWSAANPDRVAQIKRSWYERNRSAAVSNAKAWKADNPGNAAEERAKKRQATPAWADRSLMADIYELARIYTVALGRPFHVDHVVPLRSSLVCGLHAHTNLQVLPGSENIAKGNRRWPDMP